MSKFPNISGIDYESVADGPGIRTVIYLSGCSHNCPECHNPETHDPDYGSKIHEGTIYDIAMNMNFNNVVTGVTLSGGDPFFDPEKTNNFVDYLVKWMAFDPDLWIYTGYTWEQILEMSKTNESIMPLLLKTNVIVDGSFMKDLADKRLVFRGSVNQRFIDVQKTLSSGELITLKYPS